MKYKIKKKYNWLGVAEYFVYSKSRFLWINKMGCRSFKLAYDYLIRLDNINKERKNEIIIDNPSKEHLESLKEVGLI